MYIELLAGLGIGSTGTTLVQYFLKRRESAHQSKRKDLEARYQVIILLMYAALDFDGNKTSLRINRPDLKTREDVLADLKAEWYNMLLFASKKTLENLHLFITAPEKESFQQTALSMREDLGRGTFVWEHQDFGF